ncbi:TPA: RNA-directed DNA polymerase [Burkholderia vietnamiensis]|uniref:reverse transcriptase family protein n=1 Tax=Burkholderia vietnamiensis TaxID=60552 RepID=UPI001CF18061|nr:reverse transcriptase family protein [Burkholderia vietnamiensis]HDR8937059.1 RNA-directed DNA polymerase [Burkholderia vietnamiensis]HDR9260546.1 RNA-directed DNA polymerase [Burkholderia vietnamiensis]
MKSIDDVARACGVEADFISEYAQSKYQKDYYNALKLAKRGKRRKGEFRIVFAAKEKRLRALHRSISMIVTNSTEFGNHVQGFMKKRSTRTNAKQHLAAKILLHADIKGFFDAITTQHVREALISEGAAVPVAELLANVCTIDGLLRQGTRCSPTIANLVGHDMDQALLRLARAFDCVYTRYADDITFSGASVPSDDSVREVLESRGFELRDAKCFRQYRGRTQFVTGLTVVDETAPRLPKGLKRRLRLIMHYIEKFGIVDHFKRVGVSDPYREEAWLKGILMYARSIEPQLVEKWQKVLDDAISEHPPYDDLIDDD